MSEPDDNETLLAMLGLGEQLAPIFEMAKGVKANLEAEGWTEETAEAVARELMVGSIRMAFR